MADHYLTQVTVQNPHATMGLKLNIRLLLNTSTEELNNHICANAALPLDWLALSPAHERAVCVVGGGPSAADHLDDIRTLADQGALVLATNGASAWLGCAGIPVDVQFILDGKAETAELVDLDAEQHIFASQVHPMTVAAAGRPMLVHLASAGIEDLLPRDRADLGGYVLLGGDVSAGNSAVCLAYAMGYRDLHVFGLDGSHRDGRGHAYSQPMNDGMPTVTTEWDGRRYVSSLPMKCAAEKFMWLGRQLEASGARVSVYGDGLLPAMWRSPKDTLTEAEKYKRMWAFDAYRQYSPALDVVDEIAAYLPDSAEVLDLGCGTGKAAVALAQRGYRPVLVDFADNCRDSEALALPFVEADLSKPIPARARYGYCCDVMEHIPPHQVADVLGNIADAVGDVCVFRIETTPDGMGVLIGQPLHLSVHPEDWWREALRRHWPWVEDKGGGLFICRKD